MTTRQHLYQIEGIRNWFLVLLGLLSGSLLSYGQSTGSLSKVSITVSDLDQAVAFYTEVLSFEKTGEFELQGKSIQRLFGLRDSTLVVRGAALRLGEESIELLDFEGASTGRPIPHDSRSNDLWFQHIAIVVADMDKAYQRLYERKVVHVSTAPQTLPDYLPAAAGISAFYFRDPDGHNIELIHFPEGKGDPKWQETNGRLFLGVDHTAIGIEDTDQSMHFYRDLLGLQVAGNSENYGPEQEHLNQVFGARLLITGLRSERGFGLEFLDYLAPPGGRPFPKDSRPNDLWHWHTSLQVDEVAALYQKAVSQNYEMISGGLVDLRDSGMGVSRGCLLRGPDGHVVFLFE